MAGTSSTYAYKESLNTYKDTSNTFETISAPPSNKFNPKIHDTYKSTENHKISQYSNLTESIEKEEEKKLPIKPNPVIKKKPTVNNEN